MCVCVCVRVCVCVCVHVQVILSYYSRIFFSEPFLILINFILVCIVLLSVNQEVFELSFTR